MDPRKHFVVTMSQKCANSISSPGQQMSAYLNICPDERDMCPGSIISHEECEMGAAGQILAIEFNWSQFRLKLLFLLRARAIKDNCYKANTLALGQL